MSKMVKAASVEAGMDYSGEPEMANIEVKIDGLEYLYDNRFVLKGVKHRRIDWELVKQGMGPVSDELMDKIGELIWRDDLVRLLAERIS